MATKLLIAVMAMSLGAEPALDEKVPVVVAARPLPAGSVIATDSVATRPFPSRLVTHSVVRPEVASYVFGQRIVEDVDAGVPLRWSMFAAGASEAEATRCARMTASDSPPLALKGVTPKEGKTVQVLVARKDVELDSAFDEAAFTALEVPPEYAGWHAVRAVDAPKLKGQRILVPMLAGDPLYATQLAGKSEPKRCQLIFEEMGNRFLLGAPADEAKLVVCPQGAAARAGIPRLGKETHRYRVGWVRLCEKPSGVRHGPFAAWNRKGHLQLRGAFEAGAAHGRWESLDEQGAVTASVEYRQGLRHGTYLSGPDGRFARGQFESNTRQGNWRLADEKSGRVASGRFEAGRFAGTWAVELGGKARELVFEDGRPKAQAEEQMVPVAVLARDLKAGEKVTQAHLSTLPLPAWAALPHFVEQASANHLVGIEASVDLKAGAPLLWDDFDPLWGFDVTKVVFEAPASP